jgi:hypothetical protein
MSVPEAVAYRTRLLASRERRHRSNIFNDFGEVAERPNMRH